MPIEVTNLVPIGPIIERPEQVVVTSDDRVLLSAGRSRTCDHLPTVGHGLISVVSQ